MDATWEIFVTELICGLLNPPSHTPTFTVSMPKVPDLYLPRFSLSNNNSSVLIEIKQGRAAPARGGRTQSRKVDAYMTARLPAAQPEAGTPRGPPR